MADKAEEFKETVHQQYLKVLAKLFTKWSNEEGKPFSGHFIGPTTFKETHDELQNIYLYNFKGTYYEKVK